jgi:DNA invertase Pin-like site-specific DNA recombinase
MFWAEKLGGDGPPVAAYIRVSTERQRHGLSLDVQKDVINKMKAKYRPSYVYWFEDAGISGEDFERRALKKILELRERGEVKELWTPYVDRIGRSCVKSLLFFLQFTEEGGVIRTSERIYSPKDLASLLIYVIESYMADRENKARAERANASKMRNFEAKFWNKPLPLGYTRDGGWIKKCVGYEQLVKEIFTTFLSTKSLAKTLKFINSRYQGLLQKPLKRGRLRHILLDPVYVGRPTHMEATILDESLRFIDDETFRKVKAILDADIKREKVDAMAEIISIFEGDVLDFLEEEVELHHKGCGGILVKNGSRFDGLVKQQVFKCSSCGRQFRVPKKSLIKKIREQQKETQQAEQQTNPLEKAKFVQNTLTDFF